MKKRIKSATITGFVFVTFAVFHPYIFYPDYQSDAKWHPLVQWVVLLPLTSIGVFCIDNIMRRVKEKRNV